MSAALQTTKEKHRKTSQKPAKKNAKTRKKPQFPEISLFQVVFGFL
jgi:hypothetical protein